MPEVESGRVLMDAGMFIGALLTRDSRYAAARPLVEQARRGAVQAYTTAGILSEVYGALTWEKAAPRHEPEVAAEAVRLLVERPSAIAVLPKNRDVVLRTLEEASHHRLTARRVHDARHAAAALVHGVSLVYTYDVEDWRPFETDGLRIIGPPTTLTRLSQPA